MSTNDAMRMARTITQLQPAQLGRRARLRSQRAALNHVPGTRRWLLAGPSPETWAGWPAGFRPLDARIWRRGDGADTHLAGDLAIIDRFRSVIHQPIN